MMQRSLIVLALIATSAYAEFLDGNTLLARIKGDGYAQLQAIGYVTGVSDATRGMLHCPPPNITAGQMVDMVKNHLEATPELRHYSGDTHVVYVLKKSWPCANRQQPGRSS